MTLGKNKGESAKSLVAPYDELMRKAKVLQSGCEAEFKIFTVNQDENRVKWLNSEQKNESMEDKLKRLEAQAATLETQLKHARLQAEYELQRRKTAEKEKDDMDRQIGVIRELLVDKNSKSIIHENDRERLAAFTSNQRLSTQNDMSNTR
ncbi:rac GTPase-activating protein 1 [Aplysia californica]|uniref:Rac GTPase-activating protein 1 n=1 Tax=Aplysia californica TaxID=6500 RepID=A0ABM0KBF1_APLCA|nr:rac GTPase-activating protein 1 [Aplysia californica]